MGLGQFTETQFTERTVHRMDSSPNGLFTEWTVHRKFFIIWNS